MVARLATYAQGSFFRDIIGGLADLGYDVQWAILNRRDVRLPHNRLRVYVVGVRLDKKQHSWRLPTFIPWGKHLAMAQLIDPATVPMI